MVEGDNVDVVLTKAYDWSATSVAPLSPDTYDVIMSGSTFEHVEFFWLTFAEMVRVCKPGGLIFVIAPNNYREHRFPVDCYRFTTDAMVALSRYCSLDILHASNDCIPQISDVKVEDRKYLKYWKHPVATDVMLVAQKLYDGPARLIDPKTYECIPMSHWWLMGPLRPYQPKGWAKVFKAWRKWLIINLLKIK
jgi:SAM-dependent methyltransferase